MRSFIFILFLMSSCVTQQVFDNLENEKSKIEGQNKKLQISVNDLESSIKS